MSFTSIQRSILTGCIAAALLSSSAFAQISENPDGTSTFRAAPMVNGTIKGIYPKKDVKKCVFDQLLLNTPTMLVGAGARHVYIATEEFPVVGVFHQCYRSFMVWDLTAIPENAIVVNTRFSFTNELVRNPLQCNIAPLSLDLPITEISQEDVPKIKAAFDDGIPYISGHGSCRETGEHDLDLSVANADIEDSLAKGFYALGMKGTSEIGRRTAVNIGSSDGENKPVLEVTFRLSDTDGSTDTGSTDTGSTDTGSTDTGSTDTGSTDTGSTDTDTGSTDTGSTDTGSTDTGSTETGSTDTGSTDTGSTETGSMETGSTDTGSTETGSTDTGSTETGSTDTGSTETGSTDTGTGGGSTSGSTPTDQPKSSTSDEAETYHVGGGGCTTSDIGRGNSTSLLLLCLLVVGFLRRRRVAA